MENLNTLIGSVNNIFWSYLLIVVLIGCALWFSFKTRFVQFRMLGEMFRIPFEKKEQKSAISSFEAFAVSLASRVGTGNLAGIFFQFLFNLLLFQFFRISFLFGDRKFFRIGKQFIDFFVQKF